MSTDTADRGVTVALVYWGRRGGGARMTLELARALARRKDVTVSVSVSDRNDLLDDIRRLAVAVHIGATPASGRDVLGACRLLLSWCSLITWLRRTRPQFAIVVMGSPWTDPISRAMRWAIRPSGGHVARVVHDADKHPGDRATTPPWMERIAMRNADTFVVLSEHVRQRLLELGVAPDRIVRSQHGPFAVGVPADDASSLHHPSRVLFFGRLAPYKGVELLVEAARSLGASTDVDVDVRIVGDGDLDLGQLPPNVELERRWVPEAELATVLGWADIVVLPYVEASQSGIAPMAITLGIPVVATPVGGLSEQVRHGVTGVIATGTDASSLAEAIRAAVRDPEDYAALVAGCSAAGRPDGAWDTIAGELLSGLAARRLSS